MPVLCWQSLLLLAATFCCARSQATHNGHTISYVPTWASARRPAGYQDLYTTMSKVPGSFKVLHNLWWHGGRFFAKLPPQQMHDSAVVDDGLSVNEMVYRLPVVDMEQYARDTARVAFLPGATVLIDAPFQALAGHMGHWAEIVVPLYSVLQQNLWPDHLQVSKHNSSNTEEPAGTQKSGNHDKQQRGKVIDQLLLPTLQQHTLTPWQTAILETAFSGVHTSMQPALNEPFLPRVIDSVKLGEYDKLGWLVIENLFVVEDRWTHPQNKRGFLSHDHGDVWRYDNCQRYVSPSHSVCFAEPQHASLFRAAAWQLHGLPVPPSWQPGAAPSHLPPTITLLLPAGDEFPGIVNHDQLKTLLEEIAMHHGWQVRVISLSPGASWASHLRTIANTGFLVTRHSSLLASVLLLPPGSGVLEILPYKWEWAGISQIYYNISQSMGDIHHFAWRPDHYTQVQFKNASDARYHTWTPEECGAAECLHKMGKAGVIVDLEAVKKLIETKLPKILKGEAPASLSEPWPHP